MKRRRQLLLLAAVVLLALAIGAHVVYWYAPRAHPLEPDTTDAPYRLFAASGGHTVWLSFPHQNRVARSVLRTVAHQARFGPFACPPARELALEVRDGRVRLAARLYPLTALVLRAAPAVGLPDPLDRLARRGADRGTVVSLEGTLLLVGGDSESVPWPIDASGPVSEGGPVLEEGERPSPETLLVRLAQDDLDEEWRPLFGWWTRRSLRLVDGDGPVGEKTRVELQPIGMPTGAVAGRSASRTVAAPADPGVPSWPLVAWRRRGESVQAVLVARTPPAAPGSLALPSSAAITGGAEPRLSLPGESLLERLGQPFRETTIDGFRVVAADRLALDAAAEVVSALSAEQEGQELVLRADPRQLLRVVGETAVFLERSPFVAPSEARRWAAWRRMLEPFAEIELVAIRAGPRGVVVSVERPD